MTPRFPRKLPQWAVLLLVWVPVGVLFPIAGSLQAENSRLGLILGLRSAVVGAVLVAVVWWMSGRLGWRSRPWPVFYLTHLFLGAATAVVWRTVVFGLDAVASPTTISAALQPAFFGQFVAWDLVLKFVLYGFIAGVSYAVREGERAGAEQLRAATLDALATRAQLTALQSRLNPHFLFNTLHSLSALVRADQARAEEAIDELGDLLRYVLDHGGRDEVLLRDELTFVDRYLSLEQIRLGARLRVVRDIDERALSAPVPPFSVQPLVENAILHGLAPRPTGGTLWISAQRPAGVLRIEVRDDGLGTDRPGSTSGTGLASLRKRLDAWRPERTAVSAQALDGGGFSAAIVVPDAEGWAAAEALRPRRVQPDPVT